MKEPCYEDNYPYHSFERGVLTVVDDLYESELYAEQVGEGERFEVREGGFRLGRFESLSDAKSFLEGK